MGFQREYTPADIDAGQRISEAVQMHITVNGFAVTGQWLAFKLHDGSSDHVLYPTKADAVAHQFNELWCCYMCVQPEGITPADATSFLVTMRQLADNGYRLADPDKHIVDR